MKNLQSLRTIQETQELSNEVINLFKVKQIAEAVEKMRPYWAAPDEAIADFQEKSEYYAEMFIGSYGKIEGTEKIKEEKISDFAIRETFILRYQHSAIRLIFVYLKGTQGWILNAFKWDEQFEELFS